MGLIRNHNEDHRYISKCNTILRIPVWISRDVKSNGAPGQWYLANVRTIGHEKGVGVGFGAFWSAVVCECERKKPMELTTKIKWKILESCYWEDPDCGIGLAYRRWRNEENITRKNVYHHDRKNINLGLRMNLVVAQFDCESKCNQLNN